jgi:hypothetical protein
MKIFVSYTLRDHVLSVNSLGCFEKILSIFGRPYIDILHNESSDPQGYVMNTLENSDIFCALVTPEYFESHWVQIELNFAVIKQMPIVAIHVTSLA